MIDAEIAGDDVTVHALPLYHCAQLDVFFGPSIMAGGVNVVTARPVPENIFRLVERERATSFFAPPTVWISMLRSPAFDGSGPVESSQGLLRRLDHAGRGHARDGAPYAEGPLVESLRSDRDRPARHHAGPKDQLRKPGSCGRPVLNVETRVVDEEMRDVKPGEVGEIVHRSPHLMLGYYKDEEKTAEAFRGGWFHSGDLATVDEEGFISVVDRKRDMIKTGGENVASREVEEAIYGLPGVSEVAVVCAPHPHWIEAVVAVVVPKAGAILDERQVLEHAHKVLAAFKAAQTCRFRRGAAEEPEREDSQAATARGA